MHRQDSTKLKRCMRERVCAMPAQIFIVVAFAHAVQSPRATCACFGVRCTTPSSDPNLSRPAIEIRTSRAQTTSAPKAKHDRTEFATRTVSDLRVMMTGRTKNRVSRKWHLHHQPADTRTLEGGIQRPRQETRCQAMLCSASIFGSLGRIVILYCLLQCTVYCQEAKGSAGRHVCIELHYPNSTP